ncbi:unnamed protein product [Effrenium voratum]|uniref:B30.2/SPRY domain-containing protein n=1 Tax=Effrenium voratum TaxID=2562239 RepID=A0AA36N088_9DINO|nr:unnamed protein product [Effrenium voratum]CAJ1389886.1 unnamed protein product [Effrenium voratum]CAJ1424646.1 unnamed protein product [Effrenium voratum]|mmetsp:Transcript_128464/g.304886  ORF Transcript_128464/g.304886 Transcript_128464/m.304886 type:complete len:311 (+) Transcript_128464:39-971(+)
MAVAWRDDGSSAVQSTGPELKIGAKESKGSPANALYPTALDSGSYFEVTCQEIEHGSPFIGIGTEEKFGAGYSCKGLFYGGPGNLSDGGGCLKSQWGEDVKKGDVVGILVQVKDSKLTMTVYHNGRCLGPAFEAAYSGSKIYPVVRAKSEGDIFQIATPPAPSALTREKAKGGHPAAGKWTLDKLLVGPELGESFLAAKMKGAPPPSVTVEEQAGELRLSIKVANTLNFTATSTPDASLAPFDALTAGPGMSTKMLGPEGAMEVESKIEEAMPTIQKWLAKDDTLIISGPTIEMTCTLCAGADIVTDQTI